MQQWLRCYEILPYADDKFCLISFLRTLPNSHLEKIVETITKFEISALLVIGGFEV